MKFIPYVLRHLRQNWIRTSSTACAIAFCIFLFCTLQTFVASLNGFLRQGAGTRLITRNNVSLVFRLPNSYEPQIAAVPGVKGVAISNYFGGTRDLSNPNEDFTNFAIEAEPFLAMYPEFFLPESQKETFLRDRRGCIVGRALADRFHWRVGQSLQLQSTIPSYRTGKPFEFVVSGIYDTDQARYPGTNDALLFFHYSYLDEATGRTAGVGTYRVEIANARDAGRVSHAIDALFENSDAQSHTETEAQYRASLGILGGNLVLLLNGIGLTVMFTMLLVTANTMSMAIRERRMELAVLKTLGFPSALVMALVLMEGAAIGALGSVTGLLLGRIMIELLPKIPVLGDLVQSFPRMNVPPAIAAAGVVLGVLLAASASLIPSITAYRAKVVDLFRND